ncbi:unnamed protein product, partial [Symbiodinium natans]
AACCNKQLALCGSLLCVMVDSVEAEAFSVPPPPEVGQPRSPATAVTFLDAPSDAVRHENSHRSLEAWPPNSGHWRLFHAYQVIELVASSLALTCWTAMCVLDVSGYWNVPFDSEDSLLSHALCLGVWCVACTVFVARLSSICRQRDVWPDLKTCRTKVAGHGGFRWELLMLLATQWSLVSGALAWLVFHAVNQRRPQVMAGLLAILALLALLLCTVVNVLREHRRRVKVISGTSVTAAPPSPKAEERPAAPDVDLRNDETLHGRTEMELSSMTSSVMLDLNRLSFKSHRSSARSSARSSTHDQEDSLSTSGNYLGKLWSDDGSVSKQSVLKQGVDSMDSDIFVGQSVSDKSDKSLKQVVFGEMPIRSSRGRWRPLFPSMAESTFSPSASMSCSVASVRRLGSQKFVFESEEDAQRSLAEDIKSHSKYLCLAVQTSPKLDRSASPCLSGLSMGSQKSHLSVPEAAKEAYRRPSTTSAMSDVSDSRANLSQQSSLES